MGLRRRNDKFVQADGKVFKERFGEVNQADRYRIEVKNRKRQPGETLRSLYSDIRRLVALALPGFDRKARETMASDYFIGALNDPDFALKVRERSPKDLDTALRIALQLEVWSADVDRNRRDHAAKDRRAREMARAENRADETTEKLQKHVAELQKQLRDLQQADRTGTVANPKTGDQSTQSNRTVLETTAKAAGQPNEGTCWGCGDPNHRMWRCPKLSYAEKMKLDRRRMRPLGDHYEPSCIIVRCKGQRIEVVVDTGSDVTIAVTNVAKKHRWKIRPAELQSVKMANGEHMLIEGLTTENFKVGKKSIRSDVYISPDLDDLILGVDWMKKQGRMIWDFDAHQIRFGAGGWITFSKKPKKAVVESTPKEMSSCRRNRKRLCMFG